MVLIINCHRIENESEADYLVRIGNAKDNGLIHITWDEIADIINSEFRSEKTGYNTESTYRKRYNKMRSSFRSNCSSKNSTNNQPALNDAENREDFLRELECQKIQFRDERRAWQQQNYLSARVSQKLDLLEEKLLEQGRINFKTRDVINYTSDNDVLVILSDLHIGQTFNSNWGIYNSDVAKERLEKLLNEIINIKKTHNSQNCYVSLQGDALNGSIHKTIQVTNRENVIEQIKLATELISSFCYELTKHFDKVVMSSVSGNHSRIDKKEEALHDERLDDIIAWGVKLSLQHIENFLVLEGNLDNGISVLNIRNKDYVAVHGDMDKFSDKGVSNLCMFLGHLPYAITFGHLHTCALDETNGIKMIRSGSLAGSGDSYTVEKRLYGEPSQMICVCDSNGLKCCYPTSLV